MKYCLPSRVAELLNKTRHLRYFSKPVLFNHFQQPSSKQPIAQRKPCLTKLDFFYSNPITNFLNAVRAFLKSRPKSSGLTTTRHQPIRFQRGWPASNSKPSRTSIPQESARQRKSRGTASDTGQIGETRV